MVKSHVPSPTLSLSDEYELDPGGDMLSAGAMAAVGGEEARVGRRYGREGKAGGFLREKASRGGIEGSSGAWDRQCSWNGSGSGRGRR